MRSKRDVREYVVGMTHSNGGGIQWIFIYSLEYWMFRKIDGISDQISYWNGSWKIFLCSILSRVQFMMRETQEDYATKLKNIWTIEWTMSKKWITDCFYFSVYRSLSKIIKNPLKKMHSSISLTAAPSVMTYVSSSFSCSTQKRKLIVELRNL